MDLIKKAKKRAKGAHKGQTRKGSGAPYYTHPKAVAELVQMSGGGTNAIAAAYLHDVLEDTDTPIDDFPEEVVTIVTLLTHKGGYKNAKVDAILRLEGSRNAILVKLADRLHNLSDVSSKRDSYAKRPEVRQATELLLAMAIDTKLDRTHVFMELRKLLRELTNGA